MESVARIFTAVHAVRPRMAPKRLPAQEELRRLFNYDDNTGDLIWRYRTERGEAWNSRCAGQRAGSPTSNNYFQITIDNRHYLIHRVIWKWMHGTEPPVVEHINGDTFDNRSKNLRATVQSLNVLNRRRRKGKALPKGVFQYGSSRPFARIVKDGVKYYLGTFDTAAEAHAAYCASATTLHRDFARHD